MKQYHPYNLPWNVFFEIKQLSANVPGSSYGPIVNVYNGTRLRYSDYDDRVRPYTEYQYMVSAVNSVGKADGPWASVFTKEAPPSGLQPPDIKVR